MNAMKGLLAMIAAALGACAAYPGGLAPGMSRDEVISRFGPPRVERRVDGGSVMVYPTGPMGQYAFAARLGPDQRVASVAQVLTIENFARARIGNWGRDELLENYGPPSEVRTLSPDKVWWSYRYRENGVWNSLYTFILDSGGVVRAAINGPDPLFERNDDNRL